MQSLSSTSSDFPMTLYFSAQLELLLDETSPNHRFYEQSLGIREKSSHFWFVDSELTLRMRLKAQNTNRAKNIIYFLGDGMSLTTVAATRIFQGQLNGRRGEENILSFEKFPNFALSKVRLQNVVFILAASSQLVCLRIFSLFIVIVIYSL